MLASRRGPDSPGARALLDELAALGTHATIDACDVADSDRLAALLRQLADAGEPVTAVVHAAGTAGPTMPLVRLTLAEFADVVAGKVAGAGALDRLLDGPDGAKVAAFVLFSSISGVWGSGNQAAYSAGNAYLDALAARRRAEGRPATAVAFGPWADAGLGAEPALRDYLTRRGLRPLPAEPAVTALTRAVAAGETAMTVVDVAWETFLPSITAARPSRFFEELPVAAPPAGPPGEPALSARVGQAVPTVLGLRPPRRARALAELVQAEAAAILGYDTPEELDPTRRFLELGFDSLASVELSRRLAAASGLTLATQVVFEHPTVTELAAHLDTLAAQVTAAPHPADAASGATPGATAAASGTATTGGAAEVGVRGLYRQACAQGKFAAGVGVLRAAARLRPVFDTAAAFGPPARPVRLATGPAPVALVCLPSMVAPSGPHNFARIALHLHGLRDVFALPHPGFGDGELLPANAELVVEMHADTVARAFPITPVVLAGYSSGGWLAHAIASALEERGGAPRGGGTARHVAAHRPHPGGGHPRGAARHRRQRPGVRADDRGADHRAGCLPRPVRELAAARRRRPGHAPARGRADAPAHRRRGRHRARPGVDDRLVDGPRLLRRGRRPPVDDERARRVDRPGPAPLAGAAGRGEIAGRRPRTTRRRLVRRAVRRGDGPVPAPHR